MFAFGDAGVDFFFVLSGFIITWVHAQDLGKPSRLWAYLLKRAVRIYPIYWIIFTVILLAALFSPSLSNSVPHDFPTIIRSLALVPQDPAVVGGTGAPVIISAWSMQYEVLFYVLVAIFILSRLLGIVVSCALLANYAVCLSGEFSFAQSFVSSNLLFLFIYGALIAYFCRSSIRLGNPLLIAIFGGAAFLLIGALEDVLGTQMWVIDRRLGFGFLSGVIILGLVRAESCGQFRMKVSALALIGDSSYSLYLIHFPLISILCKIGVGIGLAGTFGALIAFPAFLSVCILTSLGFYVAIERPMLRRLRIKSPSRIESGC